jgi:hypothetical protein
MSSISNKPLACYSSLMMLNRYLDALNAEADARLNQTFLRFREMEGEACSIASDPYADMLVLDRGQPENK